ncbi:cobyrinate a,c-diamide synthase [Tepidimonas charontis]|uniref:Hydrogenobyrinate a,c-diamide synthase n=1 Tax=Tepidimonas charontis TaxID=2267262 RepID=A0A554XKZ2_9BURK|nr:cobyrinate a,c-diamide synthase [Tepidimonas charontis]TSE36494.1 Hydrogenobyrinate a,c-diamide synthase [Tepidimonas charontis]
MPNVPARCPTLLIAAPASGQGKTTVTAALARLLTRRGWRVRVFKCGPDFLDPHWLALASGQPVDNLDLWLNGERDVAARLHAAASENDAILIEGVMGLFDGEPSAADLAMRWRIPVLAVVDASAMVGTVGALAYGLRHYRPRLPWAGVLANRVASDGHAAMVRAAVEAAPDGETAVGWLGALPRQAAFVLPERHLGLTVAAELPDALARLDAVADALAFTPLGLMDEAGWQRWVAEFASEPSANEPTPQFLYGRTVAVARDAAFAFIYPANVQMLRELGAEVVFFSPLADEPLPPCDAVWLPGGYPELHAAALAAATRTRETLAAHVGAGRPVWAECGGMLALCAGITLVDGVRMPLWGLLPGEVSMHSRLGALGPQAWRTPHGELRGHTFHYSTLQTALTAVAHTMPARAHGRTEAVYRHGSIQASYFHAWFASSPRATAALFGAEVGQ